LYLQFIALLNTVNDPEPFSHQTKSTGGNPRVSGSRTAVSEPQPLGGASCCFDK